MYFNVFMRFATIFVLIMQHLLAQNWNEGMYKSGNNTLPYQYIQSNNESGSNTTPLLIFLHGSGERGDDNQLQLTHGGALFRDAILKKKIEGMIVFPQCPKEDYWARVERVVQDNDSLSFSFLPYSLPTPAMKLLLGLLDSLGHLPFVDQNRIYIGGLSMGGMGTFELLSRRPEMFAAAFPICGGGNPEAVENFDPETAVWVFHGAKDQVVQLSYSTSMVDRMQKLGMKVKLSIYPETGHNAWDKAFAETELLPWIYSRKKK